MPPWSQSSAASLIHAAALRPCRAKARTGGDVPPASSQPGTAAARQMSAPPPHKAVGVLVSVLAVVLGIVGLVVVGHAVDQLNTSIGTAS